MNRDYIPGSVVRAKSPWPFPDHLGIADWPLSDGTMTVIDNSRYGVRIRTLRDFAGSRGIQFDWVPRTSAQQESALCRAQSLIGHPYDLLDANCEHFVHWVVTGKAESPQLRGYLTVFGFLGALLFLQ